MSSGYIHAIRGPVLLIVLGVLMLVDHRTAWSFWQTWPLLLVTGGLLVLAERAAIKENPWAAPMTGSGFAPAPPPPTTTAYRPFGQAEPGEAPPASRENEPEGGPRA
jgi:hypothetical protein